MAEYQVAKGDKEVEEKRHLIPTFAGPAVRVVLMPGVPVHTTEPLKSEEIPVTEGKPWPSLYECEGIEDAAEKRACIELHEGEVCPECGHRRHETGLHHHDGQYIDYSVELEPGLAVGEPIAAGEVCHCPCHKEL